MNADSPAKLLSKSQKQWVLLALFGGFTAILAWPRVYETPGLFWGVVGWWLVAIVILMAVRAKERRDKIDFTIEPRIRRPHYIQLTVQGAVFVYWGYYWDRVYQEMPLILSQIIFAYMCEYLICRYKYGHWRLGFGPIPIVLSTNLFLWFHDPYFAWQYAMIFLAFGSREFIRWNRDGRDVHIFNPSAFALCVIALALIIGEWPHLTFGQQISITLGRPEHMYVYIFLMGAVVQWFFGVTLVTMSAAVTSVIVGHFYFQQTGEYMYVDTVIPIAVFLGMNLLVTDPASSPQSNGGKVLFGMLYGLAVFFMYDVLRSMGRPAMGDEPGFQIAWLDKLLFLPFLNLLARPLDRIGRLINLEKLGWRVGPISTNRIHVGIWAVIFMGMLPLLVDHPGRSIEFWETSCAQENERACENVAALLQQGCRGEVPQACENLGLMFQDGRGVPVDYSRAGGAFKHACDLKLGSGCRQLGVMFAEGQGISKNNITATHLFETGCGYGDGLSCAFVGEAYGRGIGVKANLASSLKFYEKSCGLSEPQGCTQLATAYRTGAMGGRDTAKASRLYTKACNGGHLKGCAILATMKWLGDGIEQDRAHALDLLNQACQGGFKPACRQKDALRASGSP